MDGEFSSVSTPELVAAITTLAGHLNAGNARFLALIAELDRRRGWAEAGVKSMAHWLNWQCGISLGAARELTRVADASNEDCLLNIALCGTASHVEETVRGYRRALDAEELSREAIQQRDQHLWFHTEPDGSTTIRGRVPAEVGARQPADPGKRSGRNVFGARRPASVAAAPGRGAGHAGRELPGDGSAGSLRVRPSAGRGACRCRNAQALPRRPLRAGTGPVYRRRDRD